MSLLLYFFAGITDVDWASPLSTSLVFAVLLAAMVIVLSYGFLAFAGHRLRDYKDHSGAVAFTELDVLTKMACWFSAAGIAVMAPPAADGRTGPRSTPSPGRAIR